MQCFTRDEIQVDFFLLLVGCCIINKQVQGSLAHNVLAPPGALVVMSDMSVYIDFDADAVTLAVTPESYTRQSVPSSLGRSFLTLTGALYVIMCGYQIPGQHGHPDEYFFSFEKLTS